MTTSRRSREEVDYTLLLEWLQRATEGLSDDARTRIREEITDHFHQALDAGRAAGLNNAAAARNAVEQLGCPEAAYRAFRRTYLSRWQGYLFHRFIEPPPRFPSSEISVILPTELTSHWDPMKRERSLRPLLATALTVLAALQLTISGSLSALGIGFLTLMAATAVAFRFVVPGLARRGRERDAVALGTIAEVCLWACWLLAPALDRSPTLEPRLRIAAIFAVVWIFVYLPLLAKLGNRARPASVPRNPGCA